MYSYSRESKAYHTGRPATQTHTSLRCRGEPDTHARTRALPQVRARPRDAFFYSNSGHWAVLGGEGRANRLICEITDYKDFRTNRQTSLRMNSKTVINKLCRL